MANESASRNSVEVPRDVAEFFVRWHSAGEMPPNPPFREMLERLIIAVKAPVSERGRSDKELREASVDLLKWLDSKEVKASFSQLASLSVSHSHLAIQISREFGAWAEKVLGRFRAAVSNER